MPKRQSMVILEMKIILGKKFKPIPKELDKESWEITIPIEYLIH